MPMTFEDWIRTQIDARAAVSMRLGQSQDGTSASIMTWSDKRPGTWFWDVQGERVTLIEFMDADPNPAAICRKCNKRRDRHEADGDCTFSEPT